MAYLNKVDAAMFLGCSVELIEYFIATCPKTGEDRTLQVLAGEIEDIDEDELVAYQHYLNQPWPRSPSGERPHIPKAIAGDIKREAADACAICGHMDNGEVAHVNAVADTLNNSPDDLIYLCPNHHTKYDYGYRPASNLTAKEVGAAKLMRRTARRRMMRCEANVTRTADSIVRSLRRAEQELEKPLTENERLILNTEISGLLAQIPVLMEEAAVRATADLDFTASEKSLVDLLPLLAEKVAHVGEDGESVRETAIGVVAHAREVILDLDEVDCPHCEGRGVSGWMGRLCAYCGGSCFISNAKADAYSRDAIDEVDCPRCEGSGRTGRVGDICAYCRGDGFVTGEAAEDYTEGSVDEVDCPHCEGRGTVGWLGEFCCYCGGSCFISKDKAYAYDRDEIDEVDCPRCEGSGRTGRVGDTCAYCRGDGFVTREEARDYTEGSVAEVDCPHCEGRGTVGRMGTLCSYCGGSCFVSSTKAEEYARDEIDEVDCPRCAGSGTTGRVGDTCRLCKGDCVVDSATEAAHLKKYGR